MFVQPYHGVQNFGIYILLVPDYDNGEDDDEEDDENNNNNDNDEVKKKKKRTVTRNLPLIV